MSSTYNLNYKRWGLRGVSDMMSCTAMEAMTALAYERMTGAAWVPLTGQTSDLPPHKYLQSGFQDGYDAAKYCGDYDSASAKQKAYAAAVCYTIKIPADALAGTVAKIEQVAATLYGDRWTSCGAVLAAILTSSPTPPTWADVLAATYSSPDPVTAVDDADPTWQAPLREVVRSNTTATGDPLKPDTSCDAVIAVGVDATAYLHVVLRLGDYIPTYLAWVEGGAMLLGSTLAVTFDRDVSEVPPPPDSQLVDSDHDGWSDLAEYYAGTHPGDSRDAPAVTLNLVCDYPGSVAGGQIVVHAFSNAAMIGRPDAVYQIPMAAWTVEGTTRFLASLETSKPVEGRIREGDVWFFAFIDAESAGVYHASMPACVATYGKTSISWGHNIVRFIFSAAAFGYARLQWGSTPPMGVLVTITRPGPVTCFQKRIFGRNYIHEGDFIFLPSDSAFAGVRSGLPMYDYESVYTATIGEETQTVTHLWFESATPRVNAYVDAAANDVEVRWRDMCVRWIGDIRSCGFAIRVERFVGDVWQDVLIRYAYAAQPYATSGLIGQFELVVNYDSNGSRIDFEDGTYRASVCNLVNQTDVEPTTISGVVGGGGAKGGASWPSSITTGLIPPKSGGTSSFGQYSAKGGGAAGCIAVGLNNWSFGGEEADRPIVSKTDGTNGGACGGGGTGTIAYMQHVGATGRVYSFGGSWDDDFGFAGGYCTLTPAIPASIGLSAVCCGAGGGGTASIGNNCNSSSNGSGGGKGTRVVLDSIDSFFGCGGGGSGGTNGGNGRRLSVATATTGQGGAGSGVADGFTTPGLDARGDGGGGGTTTTHGRGGTGVVYVLEHLDDDTTNLISLFNDNADKTTDKSFTYTPTEGALTVDVLIVGGGGAGGFMTMHSSAVSKWGAKYCGGGGGGGGVLLILGMSIANNNVSTGWTTPVEITVDTTDGTTAEGPFSVGGTITSTFSEPEQLTIELFRKRGITTDSAGNVSEGFGGLPAAVLTTTSDAGTFAFSGIEPGDYLLLATVSGQGWQDGFWFADAAGRPKPISVNATITDADIAVG